MIGNQTLGHLFRVAQGDTMTTTTKTLLESTVISVGEFGRGFVVQGASGRYVITSAHRLPYSPTYHVYVPKEPKKLEPLALRIMTVLDDPMAALGRPKPPPPEWPLDRWIGCPCEHLLGKLGERPAVSAECLFLDPIAGLAVLGTPSCDHEQEFNDYEALTNSVSPLQIADTAEWSHLIEEDRGDDGEPLWLVREVPIWLLPLTGKLVPCTAQYVDDEVISGPPSDLDIKDYDRSAQGRIFPFVPADGQNLAGSPIVVDDGSAIGVVTGHRTGSRLTHHLPGWLLRELTQAREG
jgi:hypothetical protein